jgi:colanic acid biosynthesis glycosyl transferase WcaI
VNKKILIHSIAFSPDGVSTAYLYNDLAIEFKESGYEVVVLTTTPHYNVVAHALATQPLNKRYAGLYYESNFHGIRVVHVPQKKFKITLLRIFGFLYWHFLSFFLALMQRNISIILSPSPPLTIGFLNILIAKLKGARVIYNVQEIYPDILIKESGKIPLFIKPLRGLEKFIYNNSDAITTIDQVFYNTIAPRFKDVKKLHIIPNFVDTDIYKPIDREAIKLNTSLFPQLDGIVKIMYAGNIGHAQDWEPVVELARRMKGSPVAIFIIGEGVMKQYLQNQIAEHRLTNIHLIEYQQRELMPQIIAYADIHFIFMKKEMEDQGFPSKVYTIMACNKPLLIMAGENTPLTSFLKPLNCARIITFGSLEEKCEQLTKFVNEVIEQPQLLTEMSYNGFKIIRQSYSKTAVTKQYLNLCDEILKT